MQCFRGVRPTGHAPAATAGSVPNVPCALTIGNFDGVHLGHRALLARLVDAARARNLAASVMTFEPHPREFFAPASAPTRLSTLREKLALLEECGVDRVHVCRFDARFAARTADDFVRELLVDGLAVRHVLIGDDFRYGQRRAGDFAALSAAGAAHGFTVDAMHTLDLAGERVSSSAVRAALADGDMEHAARLLGRPYTMAGRVMHGRKLGRQIGFPTANVHIKHAKLPLGGVYAVRVSGLGSQPVWGAASLGVRPTLGDGLKPVLEVHLLDFSADIYGAHIAVSFVHKLRDEVRYDSIDLLTAQIGRDVAAVRAYFESPNHG